MTSSNNGVVGRRRGVRFRHVILGLWLAACGGAVGQRTAGGESHFLRQCEDDCGAGLECVSGVCTRGCLVGEDDCTDLAANAECTDASIEPGALAVCDVSCGAAEDCAKLGSGFECENGFCRGSVLPGQSPSGGSAGTSSGGPMMFASCNSRQGCSDPSETCVDIADDGCNPMVGDGCPGNCTKIYQAAQCSGAALNDRNGTPCPDGMSCVVHDPNLGLIPPGICVGADGPTCTTSGSDECPEGFKCAQPGPCVPELVDCHSGPICKVAAPPDCSYGYARSFVDGCFGPCVPVDRCGCSDYRECPSGSVCGGGSCGQLLPWHPPNECALPFDAGPCDAAMPVFAFVDGECRQQQYGGCEGNANRFTTLEQCMAVCEGRPFPNACPEDRKPAAFCTGCSPSQSSCGAEFLACVKRCTGPGDCNGELCLDGACQSRAFCSD